MGDLKLFTIGTKQVDELEGRAAGLERSLQVIFERNLETLLGVRFLESEYSTSHGGRMDTLGIDENGCPVIIEYKRDRSENVINQGLFYLDWLMDHKAAFELIVQNRLGRDEADKIEWSAPRLVCIASDFTKYDEHAVNQMHRNIELIRYRRFGDDLLLLDLLTAASAAKNSTSSSSSSKGHSYTTVSKHLENANENLTTLFEDIRDFMISRGDDVQERTMKFYVAFTRIKNFACVEIKTGISVIRLYLKVNPASIDLEDGFTRDMRNTSHFGTGDLEVTIKSYEDLERAKPLIQMSYEAS
ncbi:MAG: DUF5655 domain-containing protein [Alphaproteobacteria bacterium]